MFDPTTFTGIHTWLSLVALGTGIIVVIGLFGAREFRPWSALFLATAVATSVTGFGFPFSVLLPSHVVGAISLVVLGLALLARYRFHLAGPWRWIYVIGVVSALYFLVFVAIAQAFQKVAALRAAAPTLSEAPFAVAQSVALVLFAAAAIAAVRRFRTAPSS